MNIIYNITSQPFYSAWFCSINKIERKRRIGCVHTFMRVLFYRGMHVHILICIHALKCVRMQFHVMRPVVYLYSMVFVPSHNKRRFWLVYNKTIESNRFDLIACVICWWRVCWILNVIGHMSCNIFDFFKESHYGDFVRKFRFALFMYAHTYVCVYACAHVHVVTFYQRVSRQHVCKHGPTHNNRWGCVFYVVRAEQRWNNEVM
jgi:hypothetical protein